MWWNLPCQPLKVAENPLEPQLIAHPPSVVLCLANTDMMGVMRCGSARFPIAQPRGNANNDPTLQYSLCQKIKALICLLFLQIMAAMCPDLST